MGRRAGQACCSNVAATLQQRCSVWASAARLRREIEACLARLLRVLGRLSCIDEAELHQLALVLLNVDVAVQLELRLGRLGERFHEISMASELKLLASGVDIMIPDDLAGGVIPIKLEVHFLGLCADLLGAAGCGPWVECFRAQHPCLDCW